MPPSQSLSTESPQTSSAEGLTAALPSLHSSQALKPSLSLSPTPRKPSQFLSMVSPQVSGAPG